MPSDPSILPSQPPSGSSLLLGLLPGDGIGPEIAGAARRLLDAVAAMDGFRVEVREITAAPDGSSEAISAACRDVLTKGGTILAGPLRSPAWQNLQTALGLEMRVNPVIPFPELAEAGPLQIRSGFLYDLLVVHGPESILEESARLAARRRGLLAVVAPGGSWEAAALAAAERHAVELRLLDPAFACTRMLSHPKEFDVIAAPDDTGRILAALGGLLMGSRTLGFGVCHASGRPVVFQPNHGSADDLAGSGLADPCGLFLALGSLLESTLGGGIEARLTAAIRRAWKEGWRTADVAAPGLRTLSTEAMGGQVARCLRPAG